MDARDILIRYGEIGTKGKNRGDFEKKLARNVRNALTAFEHGPVERPRGRIVVRDTMEPAKALARVKKLPGVVSASLAARAKPDMADIARVAVDLAREGLDHHPGSDPLTFKVETVRSFKGFPLTSMELSAELGGILLNQFPRLKVRMKAPELLLSVEVRAQEILLATMHCRGPGGLPVGSTGKVVVLLSGGIDSPVAAYMAMKRGARAVFINYHSYPFIPAISLDKVKALVTALGAFQGHSQLNVAPFADIQVAIKRDAPEPLRTLLYRRMMIRLAERVAAREHALALVTGESLGQVASQTLENIACIGDATRLPILRPLIGFDKMDVVELARHIGTYDISIRPYPDCCTVFQPRKPRIRSSLDELEGAEENLDVAGLVEEAFAKVDTEIL